jgi:signal transduction histidine kinase
VLDRELDQELTHNQLEELSDVARSAVADLRQLALSLRPPSLDDLGLATALEAIAEREQSRGARKITLHCDGYPSNLAPQAETCVYHVIEDAIKTLDGELTINLNAIHDRRMLRIELSGHSGQDREQLLEMLATARARLELIGGTLQAAPRETDMTEIVAELPLRLRDGADTSDLDHSDVSPRVADRAPPLAPTHRSLGNQR